MRLSLLAISLATGAVAYAPDRAWDIVPWTVLLAAFGLVGSAARQRTGPDPVSD